MTKYGSFRYMTAIIFVPAAGLPGFNALKYHNIKDTKAKRAGFEIFAKSKGATHVNYYDKRTRDFIEQIKLINNE